MTVLTLVRHGETEENVAHILQGHLPGHLTPRGIAQAKALRQQLASEHFDVMLASDLRRAVDTALILAPAVGLTPELTPLLRERDWGSLTGHSIAGLDTHNFPPDVETVEALFVRARRFLQTVTVCYAGLSVLAVTHGLFARVIRAAVTGKTIRDIPRMDNATTCRLELAGTPVTNGTAQPEETGATAS